MSTDLKEQEKIIQTLRIAYFQPNLKFPRPRYKNLFILKWSELDKITKLRKSEFNFFRSRFKRNNN